MQQEHRAMPVWQSMDGRRYCDRFTLHGGWVGWPCDGETEMAPGFMSPACTNGDHMQCFVPTCSCASCDCKQWAAQ